MIEITQIRTKQKKNPDTKTTYYPGETTTEIITEREYRLTTEEKTLKHFRRSGGKEHVKRSYTCRGYRVVKLTSISPSGETKTTREFKFQ